MMGGCRSSCLVPVSQLTPRHRATEMQILGGLTKGDSFEVIISYKFDRPFAQLTPRENGSEAIHNTDKLSGVMDSGTPCRTSGGNSNLFISTNSESTDETLQTRDYGSVRTPLNGVSTSDVVMPADESSTSVSTSGLGNTSETGSNSVIRELRNRCNKDADLVNFDLAAIHQAILSKVLSDAEERNLVVTFVQDDDYAADWPDVDLVDHEFEPIETHPLFPPPIDRSVCYILSKLEGNLFDTRHANEPEDGVSTTSPLEPPTDAIEAFNRAVRFSKIKERKDQLMQHMLDTESSYKRQAQGVVSDLHYSGRTRFKNKIDEVEQLESEPPKTIEDKISLVVKEFSFFKKRKKMKQKSTPVRHATGSISNGVTPSGVAATPVFETSAVGTTSDVPRPEEPGRRRGILRDGASNDMADAVDTVTSAVSDLKFPFSINSFDRSTSQPRAGSSGSLNKESSQHVEGVAKRGVLADSRHSSGSSNGGKPSKPKSSSEVRTFETATTQNGDWSSEMWGSFINVIHSRRKTLGHGSFSTVSFAFLRLQPHLYIGKGKFNGSGTAAATATTKQSKDSNRNRGNGAMISEVNGEPTPVDVDTTISEPNGSINDPKSETSQTITDTSTAEAEVDVVDQMIKIIDGSCSKCANVSTLDCAVKSIKDVFPHARFQYIREKEMMLHFNSNVLKPLACRLYNGDSSKTYQLLMPKAHGDLYEMLKQLIKYRTRKTENPVYITNPSTGKQEQKIIGLKEKEVKFLFFQILSGLAFIQMCFQANIHRHSDIKLQNVLVYCRDEDKYNPMRWRLCLADFGCSIMLHPTQHFEGACMFKNLQQSISKEWRTHLSSQLTSFVRGTVRCNAPEALSYDRNGNPRSNRNNNLLMAYKKANLGMSCMMDDTVDQPKTWIKESVPDGISRLEPRAPSKVTGSEEDDSAEYYTVDMYSDMWSAGIILAELAKFGGLPTSTSGTERTEETKQSNPERLSMDHLSHRLSSTLGRGLFCRSSGSAKHKLHADTAARGKRGFTPAHKGGSNDNVFNAETKGGAVVTDEDLNLMLASEIASKCDLDIIRRLRKLKREYCWWEYPHFSSGFWALLVNLLSYEPRERFLAVEALGHTWFDDKDSRSQGIFQEIDALMAEQEVHLPMEHFYYIGSSLSLHSSSKKSQSPGESSPFTVKREDLMHLENSDLALQSLGMYGKVGQTSNAWFAGPLHFRLMTLQEPGISLPEFVSQICRRETIVLEAREKDIFGSRGFILSQLIDLKRRYMLKWNEMLSSRTVHLLGKILISRDYTKL